jgi:hypothetical protein
MVTVFLQGGLAISVLVRQAHCEQSCYQPAIQEPDDDNRQQLRFIAHCMKKD